MRITKQQLAGVDQYKYSGIDKSVLSKHVLGPFWTWLVTCFPLTLAPNTVSLVFLFDKGHTVTGTMRRRNWGLCA